MQNRYTGDIGDYSKIGLLRALQSAGFSIGLNWYLTPDETHNGDGRHVDYLHQDEYRECDPDLWLGLKAIVDGKDREVRHMENDDILKATFFSDCLDFRGKKRSERIARRVEWFAKSLNAMAGNNIVCVDPDNGLVVPSAKGGPKENKYVLPEELASYYAQGSTVVYYQHKARYKDEHYAKQLEALLRREDLPGASGLALKFQKVSQRYYMLIVQPRHREMVEKAVRDMLSTSWGDHFRLLQRANVWGEDMLMRWEDGFEIRTSAREGEVTISANREGLLSLANILVDLAEQDPGSHVHLDEHNSLEDGSVELIIQRA